MLSESVDTASNESLCCPYIPKAPRPHSYFDGPGDPYIKLSSLPKRWHWRVRNLSADRHQSTLIVSTALFWFSQKSGKLSLNLEKEILYRCNNGCWGAFIIQGMSLYLVDYKRFLRQLLILIWKMCVLVKHFRRFCVMNLVYMIT